VRGALVEIQDVAGTGPTITMTDDQGQFHFSFIPGIYKPQGTYKITVSAEGYQPKSVFVKGNVGTVNFTLR
jgi:hypothetical protein